MTTETPLKPCPFCNHPPRHKQSKTLYCQLHGEPSATVEIYCFNSQCFAKPSARGGNCYDVGKYAAALVEAAKRWNYRAGETP